MVAMSTADNADAVFKLMLTADSTDCAGAVFPIMNTNIGAICANAALKSMSALQFTYGTLALFPLMLADKVAILTSSC